MDGQDLAFSIEDSSDVEYVFSDMESDLAFVFAIVCSIFGCVLNGVTIIALRMSAKLWKQTITRFVLSLAMSDLMFSLATLPQLAMKFKHRRWIFGDENGWPCKLFPVLFYANTAVTLFNLMAVTINRWMTIQIPGDGLISGWRTSLIITVCWVFPFAIMVPSTVEMWGRHGLDSRSQSCTILPDEEKRSPKQLYLACAFLLPCTVLVVTNILIYAKMRRMRRGLEKRMNNSFVKNSVPNGMRSREQKATHMMLTVFICFLVTYLPGVVVKVFDRNIDYPMWHVATYCLNWSSVLFNPIIYVVNQKRYLSAILSLCGLAPGESQTSHDGPSQSGINRSVSVSVSMRSSYSLRPASGRISKKECNNEIGTGHDAKSEVGTKTRIAGMCSRDWIRRIAIVSRRPQFCESAQSGMNGARTDQPCHRTPKTTTTTNEFEFHNITRH